MDPISQPNLTNTAQLAPVARLDLRPALNHASVSTPESKKDSVSGEQDDKHDVLPPPPRLSVRIDVQSGRFVNTLIDMSSQEILRQYPSDAQLAFSRAVKAYVDALARS